MCVQISWGIVSHNSLDSISPKQSDKLIVDNLATYLLKLSPVEDDIVLRSYWQK
jgi:hypothetical protein